MSCVIECFRCFACCQKKTVPKRKYSTSEAKVHNVSERRITPTVLPLAPVLQKKMIARSPKREPSLELNRQPHNRFISSGTIKMTKELKE